MDDITLPDGRRLPAALLSATFARGGGPGGQNVNKVASKVDLRLNLNAAEAVLGAEDLARIREKLASRLDADGRLQVTSSEHRSQQMNLEAAVHRLINLLAAALKRPKTRRATRPSLGSKHRRIETKKRRGDVKRGRRPGDPERD